ISTGGGGVADPRNRRAPYRGPRAGARRGGPQGRGRRRRPARQAGGRGGGRLARRRAVLADRLRRSPNVGPLVTGRDPIGTLRDLAARRERFYGATDIHQSGVAEVHGVVDAVEAQLGRPDRAAGTT